MRGIEERDAAAGIRTCTECGFAGPYNTFPSNGQGGRRRKCRACHAAYSRAYARDHKEQISKSQSMSKKRNRHKIRITERKWKEANKSSVIEKASRYYAKHKDKVLSNNSEWRKENKLRVQCRDKVKQEVLSGRMQKPVLCQQCGAEKRLDGHHPDYSRPLSVVWLCRKCHRMLHDSKGGVEICDSI